MGDFAEGLAHERDVRSPGAGPGRHERTRPATKATFSVPGEYILRVQANDATGDGGGGFQCCWTNAHVRVDQVTATVK